MPNVGLGVNIMPCTRCAAHKYNPINTVLESRITSTPRTYGRKETLSREVKEADWS